MLGVGIRRATRVADSARHASDHRRSDDRCRSASRRRAVRADGGPVGVVLSHGFTGMPGSMRPWAEHLAAAGYTRAPAAAARPRHPLAGRQPGPLAGLVRRDRARLRRAADALRPGLRCGLSMGGTLVTRLAEQRGPTSPALVLVNPSCAPPARTPSCCRYIAWAVPSRPSIGGDIKKPGVAEPAYDRIPVKAFVSLQKLWARDHADLAGHRSRCSCCAAASTTSSSRTPGGC